MDPVALRVGRWLATHHDVISLRRAERLGLTPHQVRGLLQRGEWRRAHPEVYIRTASTPTPHQALMAAVVWGERGSRAAGLSAGWLHGLLDVPPRPTVLLGPGHHRRGRGVAFIRSPLALSEAAPPRAGIPCTGLARTLLDSAGVLSPVALQGALDRAMAVERHLARDLAGRLDPGGAFHGQRGSVPLRLALDGGGYAGVPSPSVLESHMARIDDRLGVEGIAREIPVRMPDGEVFRLDFGVPEVLLAWEVDGYAFHSSPAQMRGDRRRRRRLAEAGWTVLVFTWRDVVEDPEGVAAELRRALRSRSVA